MFRMTIKTKILTIFFIVVSIVASALLYSQYHFSKQIAMDATAQTFTRISKEIQNKFKNEAKNIKNILDIKSKHIDIEEKIEFGTRYSKFMSFVELLQSDSSLYSIYVTTEKGNFFALMNMYNNSELSKAYNPPKNTKWLTIKVIKEREERIFLDEKYEVIGKQYILTNYNPKTRPWYKNALKTSGIVSTPPYLFWRINTMGITYAKHIQNTNIVLGIDYTMKQLGQILADAKPKNIDELFIVTSKGEKYLSSVYATSFPGGSEQKIDQVLVEALKSKRIDEIIKYSDDKNDYFVIFDQMDNKTSYLGIEVNTNKLYKIYRKNLAYSFLIAFIVLLFAFPLIFIFAGHIAKPIKVLIEENEKIKARKFVEVKKVDTNIVEINALSNSMYSMAHSIEIHDKEQDELLNSIVKLIAEAIDKKSTYTGGHCERVPHIAHLLLAEVNRSDLEVFKKFSMTDKDELRAFEIGAWLHDCGKVTTPEYVVDKAVKLETIYNRIHEIRMRFEVLLRDAQIEFLNKTINETTLEERKKQLLEDFEFIASVNIGSEFMNQEKKDRIKKISKKQWLRNFNNRLGLSREELARYKDGENLFPVRENLLSNKQEHIITRDNFDLSEYEKEGFKLDVPEHLYNYGEIYNLCIEKGTLTQEERYKINEHVMVSIKMLEKIPFPDNMKNIVEYAGTHHETLVGTGYPRKLSKEELSIPARIMAIADIFEALTASDRPYKDYKTVSEAIKILNFMVQSQHIDKDLFELFLKSGVYKTYAKTYLKQEQIDEVDIEQYLLKKT